MRCGARYERQNHSARRNATIVLLAALKMAAKIRALWHEHKISGVAEAAQGY